MILQALNRYYDILLEDDDTKIAPFGYSAVGISFALDLSPDGELLNVLPLFEQVQRGKKMVEVPRSMIVPAQVKRASNVASNFLWDNAIYVLGISDKDEDKPQYSEERFQAFRQWNSSLLAGVEENAARAVIAFLHQYNPQTAREHPAIVDHLEALLKGGNLVFIFNGDFVHRNKSLRRAWEASLATQDADWMQCLVTGEVTPIARLHPNLKRVRGAQAVGASLVSFNERAYESYNRTKAQGLNSPVSEKATFAYTTVLNYLLSDANPNKKLSMGDATVVYWAESENRAYESAFAAFIDPAELDDSSAKQTGRKKAEQALLTVTEKVTRAHMLDLDALLADLKEEDPQFYILGLSPNAARVSVRFFITDPFEKIIDHIKAHYRDLAIVKEYDDQPDYLTVRRILYETVSKKARDQDAAPLLAGAVFRAILTNAPYPAALYYAIINRIRADMDDKEKKITKINYIRAAVIKAFLTRKYRYQPTNPFKEVLTMALNEQSTNPAYLLGRLFAVLEKVQAEAIGNVNASIKDRYFTSACAAPRSVFPILLRLSQHHIAKAEYGHTSDRRIQDIVNLLEVEHNPIPARLTLDEQGVFILGYYHQRADFYTTKDKSI
ncbi:MAG: type I-C CRISPR-associated protein Cas8c/Csd1 [Anaerolineae bacterium]|nr:type I-C CRISPR-associated protein Cas8c/Csd1 [Anaerolineae bacterium]